MKKKISDPYKDSLLELIYGKKEEYDVDSWIIDIEFVPYQAS